MEEGERRKESIENEKKQRILEIEQKFEEIIDMLVQNYSTAMQDLHLIHKLLNFCPFSYENIVDLQFLTQKPYR